MMRTEEQKIEVYRLPHPNLVRSKLINTCWCQFTATLKIVHIFTFHPKPFQVMQYLEKLRVSNLRQSKAITVKYLANELFFTLDFSSSSKIAFFGLGGGGVKDASSGNLGSHFTIPGGGKRGKLLPRVLSLSLFFVCA